MKNCGACNRLFYRRRRGKIKVEICADWIIYSHEYSFLSFPLFSSQHTKPRMTAEAQETTMEIYKSFTKDSINHDSSHIRTTLHFSITDKVGALDECLKVLKGCGVSLTRIESRPSRTPNWDYDFFVDFIANSMEQISEVTRALLPAAASVRVVSTGNDPSSLSENLTSSTPWFPRKLRDLDSYVDNTLSMGSDLSSDHPGANDPVYIRRRQEIAQVAQTYRAGEKIPRIDYTPEETKTWGKIFNHLKSLYESHACREQRYVFPLLEENCGYEENNIPQLQDVSDFLKDCTGFTLRPVTGLLSSRDFLNSLAFRVFNATQYIRHGSVPHYTPEPDVCHEILGHAPLFADPYFAEFSQEIGLASLGCSDEDLEKLATIYWFTVEFGLCKEGNQTKAYGAGLLSSFGEIQHALKAEGDEGAPKRIPFDPKVAAVQKYPITSYQPVYFVADGFKEAAEKVREFAATLDRPFGVRYNAYTQSIEVLDTPSKCQDLAVQVRRDMQVLVDALGRLKA